MCWSCWDFEPEPKNFNEAAYASYHLDRGLQVGSQHVSVEPTEDGIRINFDTLRTK